VHATLLDSLPLAYERFVVPLAKQEKDQYCAEATVVGPRLGIPQHLLPVTVAELDAYLSDVPPGTVPLPMLDPEPAGAPGAEAS